MIKKNEKRKLHTDHEYMKYISTTPSVFVLNVYASNHLGFEFFMGYHNGIKKNFHV